MTSGTSTPVATRTHASCIPLEVKVASNNGFDWWATCLVGAPSTQFVAGVSVDFAGAIQTFCLPQRFVGMK